MRRARYAERNGDEELQNRCDKSDCERNPHIISYYVRNGALIFERFAEVAFHKIADPGEITGENRTEFLPARCDGIFCHALGNFVVKSARCRVEIVR